MKLQHLKQQLSKNDSYPSSNDKLSQKQSNYNSRNQSQQNNLGSSGGNQILYTPSPNKRHNLNTQQENIEMLRSANNGEQSIPLNQQDVENLKNFNPDKRRQQLMDLFSSYDRKEDSQEDASPKGKIGSFQANSKNSSLTKINRDIRNKKDLDMSGSSGHGLASHLKYQMNERLITEELHDEQYEDFDYRQLSNQKGKASFLLGSNQIQEEQEDEDYEERKTLEAQLDSQGNKQETSIITETDVNLTLPDRSFNNNVNGDPDFKNLEKNPEFASQMNRLLSFYNKNQEKVVKKETVLASQIHHQNTFSNVSGGVKPDLAEKAQNQFLLDQEDQYTLFPERYVNNQEFPFLAKNNQNPLIFQMDYLFAEMRKEYIRQMLINFPEYQLGVGFEKDVKPPQDVIDKDIQFFQSTTQVQTFNKLFKQIFPLSDKKNKRKSSDDKQKININNLTSQLFKQKKSVTKVRNQTNKLIYILFSFDLKEIHRLFRKFYLEIDKDENMTFELDEMVDCFEMFSQEDMLGKRSMRKVLKSIGANFQAGIISIFKEGQITNMSFPPEIYEQVFQVMQHEGQDYIDFFNFMPYLQLFFFGKLFAAVEKREKYFKELLDDQAKNGIYQCFLRSGLQAKNLYEKNITYRMVEKVVMDMRGVHLALIKQKIFQDKYKPKCKQILQVYQKEKNSLFMNLQQMFKVSHNGLLMCKLILIVHKLQYSIGLQLMWSELRQRELEYKDQSKERLAFEFLFEERMWRLASQLEFFDLKLFPGLVIKGIGKRVVDRNNNIIENKAQGFENYNSATQVDESSYYLYDFTESLTEVFKQYCPWVKYQVIERAVYYFIWNLIHKSNINRLKGNKSINGTSYHSRQPSFGQQLGSSPIPYNKYDLTLLRIFGKAYENDQRRMALFQKMSKIKFMRFIKIETDPQNLSLLCDKILYQDCIRIMNEHSIKLLIEGQLNYNRTTEDINEADKNFFQGIPEKIQQKQSNNLLNTGQLSLIQERLSSYQDSGSSNPLMTSESDQVDGQDGAPMKKIKMKGLEDHRKRMAAKKKFLKKFSGDSVDEVVDQQKGKTQVQNNAKQNQNILSQKETQQDDVKRKDYIGVMLTSKVLQEPFKNANDLQQKIAQEKREGSKSTKEGDSSLIFNSNSTKSSKKIIKEASFVPEEVYEKAKQFDKIDLYKKVDRNQLMQQFKDIENTPFGDDNEEDSQIIQNSLTKSPGGITSHGRSYSEQIKFNRDNNKQPQQSRGQRNKITFEKKEDATHLKEQRRILNAKKLKSQMLNEIYRNEMEFKDDDMQRSCMRGCDTPSCLIF
eukprot:403337148